MSFKKEITFHEAWDKRDPNPSINCGIHGVEIRFVLKGKLGAVQFVIYTNWMLPEVTKERKPRYIGKILQDVDLYFLYPIPADLGYHSHKPMYDGQEKSTEDCPYIGGSCYYSGSGLGAGPVYDVLLREGSDGVWRELKGYYKRIFIDKE